MQERKDRILTDKIDEEYLQLIHHLGSNIHVSIYSIKPKLLEAARYLLPEQNISEIYGKLLWNEQLESHTRNQPKE